MSVPGCFFPIATAAGRFRVLIGIKTIETPAVQPVLMV
jgi:hypothetical protein